MRSFAIGFAGLMLAFGALGCRSGQSGSPTRPQSTTRDQYLILADELDATNRDNLYDAVRQVRPGWFTRRTRNQQGDAGILVYLDDRQIGNATVLRRFSARDIDRVRYLSPTEAQVRFGQTNLGRPAILVETAKP